MDMYSASYEEIYEYMSQDNLDKLNSVLLSKISSCVYDDFKENENGLIHGFFSWAAYLLIPYQLQFCITRGDEPRAGILYEEKIIFISYGLFNRLCKLARLIHSSGVLNGTSYEIEYHDLHSSKPFVGFSGDSQAGEDQLYLLIFSSLFDFILAHELGHFVNRHGERNKTSLFDDVEGHREVNSDLLIESHTRELVADNHAFFVILQSIKESIKNNTLAVNDLDEGLKHEYGAVILALVFAISYFYLMDGLVHVDHFKSSHPDRSARAHNLCALYLETIIDTKEEEIAGIIFPTALGMVEKIFDSSNSGFNSDWIKNKATSDKMKQWQEATCKEFPNWYAKDKIQRYTRDERMDCKAK